MATAAHPANELRITDFYVPWDKQALFHSMPEKHRLMVGGFGSGKSRPLLMEAIFHCIEYPGSNSILMRKTMPDLKRTCIDKFLSDVPKALYERGSQERGTFNKSDHIVYFPPVNGKQSKLYFAACERVEDVGKYLSTEFVFIGFEELGEFPYLIYDAMEGRNRCTVPGARPCMAAATNPLGIGWCVPYGDVLTPQGWRDIRSFRIGEDVYTVTPDLRLLPTIVAQVHQQFYEGPMAETYSRGLHITCTPDHAIMRRTETKNRNGRQYHGAILTAWKDLRSEARLARSVKWTGTPIDIFHVPPVKSRKRRLQQPESLPGKQFCSLLGWYLSEGNLQDKWHFQLSQSAFHKKEIEHIHKALEGFSLQKWQGKNLCVCALDWATYFRQFGKARDKFIPEFVKNASCEELECLFEALVMGDGHSESATSGQYYTTSKRLADDVCEVAFKLGYIVHLSCRLRLTNPKLEPEGTLAYCVNFKKTKDGCSMIRDRGPAKSDSSYVPFKGNVYCLGIQETHSFVIRQKGSVWISGNSWIKKLWKDKEPVYGMNPEKYNPNDYGMIHSTVHDNPILSQDEAYLNSLQKSPLRDKIYLGNLDSVTGQYFANWDPQRHIRPKEHFIFQPWQPVWVGWDYGFKHWACITFWTKAILKAITEEEKKYASLGEILLREKPRVVNVTIRELILHETTPENQAKALISSIPRSLDENGHDAGYAEDIDSIHFSWERFNPTVSNRTIADDVGDILAEAGLPRPQRGNTDRVAAWTKMYSMLDTDDWFLLRGACPVLAEAIPLLVRGNGVGTSLEDVVKPKGADMNDDIAEAARYAVAGVLLDEGTKPKEQLLREKLAGIKDPFSRSVVAYKTWNQEQAAAKKGSRGGKIIPSWQRRIGQ